MEEETYLSITEPLSKKENKANIPFKSQSKKLLRGGQRGNIDPLPTDLKNGEKSNMKNVRSRGWVVTINNPTKNDYVAMESLNCQYKVYAPEVAETGTPHIQGYVYFESQRTRSAVQKELKRAALIVPHGTPQQNRTYIMGPYHGPNGKVKELNPLAVETGICPQMGERNDLKAAAKRIRDNPLSNLYDDEENDSTYAKYPRFCDGLRNHCLKKKAEEDWANGWLPAVEVRWSRDSGKGKTRYTYEEARRRGVGVCRASIVPDGHRFKVWFESYNPGDIILFDEFVGQLGFEWCKEFFDRYPVELPFKGGMKMRVRSDIHITSNRHPTEWWPGMSDNWEWNAMMRRLCIIEMKEEHLLTCEIQEKL